MKKRMEMMKIKVCILGTMMFELKGPKLQSDLWEDSLGLE